MLEMDSPSEDKQWATKYLLDPLTAPEPSQETGPGSHFISSAAPSRTPSTLKKQPRSNSSAGPSKGPSATTYPTPPGSASPTRAAFHSTNPYSPSHRQSAFDASSNARPGEKSVEGPSGGAKGRRRGSSLNERYPGDISHRPLYQLRKEAIAADRAPHLKKKHMPGADIIDVLDKSVVGGAYHHEGPYDATLLARNTITAISPVAATRGTNSEAIRATPRENLRDALDKHVPLQGTAVIPSGMTGFDGKPMQYDEGADLMREPDAPGGPYKRWEGVKYLPEDYKGKGEPSFSVERALKEQKHTSHQRIMSDGNPAYEMQPPRVRPSPLRQHSAGESTTEATGAAKPVGNSLKVSGFDGDIRRSNTTGKRVGEGLIRRLGSLRRSKKTVES